MSVATLLRNRIVMLAAAVFLTVQFSSAQTYTVLHDFTGGSDGYWPYDGLTVVGTGNLFGGAGPTAVFRLRQTGSSWVFNPILEFNGTDGLELAGRLVSGPGGALYGAAGSGGLPECFDGGGCGLIFSLRPQGSICNAVSCPWSESVLYQFDPYGHPADGYGPGGSLTFDSSGNIFGVTGLGGGFNGERFSNSRARKTGGPSRCCTASEVSRETDTPLSAISFSMRQEISLARPKMAGTVSALAADAGWCIGSRIPARAGRRRSCTPSRTPPTEASPQAG